MHAYRVSQARPSVSSWFDHWCDSLGSVCDDKGYTARSFASLNLSNDVPGRLRIISRASGDRTLLQLPSVFSPLSSVIDMAAYGNRLAGVTMDGGFVVWEFPETITDDAPYVLVVTVIRIISDSTSVRKYSYASDLRPIRKVH